LATLRSPKLLIEALEAGETLTAATKWTASEGALSTERVLCLFITSHSSLIVNTTFAFVTQRLIRIVNFGELLLCLFTWVDIRMILLGKLEVGLLDILLRCIPFYIQHAVVVFVCSVASSGTAATPCEVSLGHINN